MKLTLKEIEERTLRARQTLNLSQCCISDNDVPLIVSYLQVNLVITTLSTMYNHIGAQGAKVLVTNTTLTALDIANNNIGVECVKALAANTKLTTLIIRYNKTNDEDIKAFVNALKYNTTLLNLQHNFSRKHIQKTLHRIVMRNRVKPWLTSLNHARLMAQAQRTDGCPLGTLPLELLSLINDYALGVNHFSFLMAQFDTRPAIQDFIAANKMVLSDEEVEDKEEEEEIEEGPFSGQSKISETGAKQCLIM